MYRWMREYPEFKEKIELARKQAADYHHDTVLQTAKDAMTEEDVRTVPQYKLLVDSHIWAAERCNPDKYGNRQKIVGDEDNPIVFMIDTGIRKEKDERKKKV